MPGRGGGERKTGPYLKDASPTVRDWARDSRRNASVRTIPPGDTDPDVTPQISRLPRLGSASFESVEPEADVRTSVGAEIRMRRSVREGERIPFFDWAMKVPEPKSGKLDFRRFPFQVELYGEESANARELVVCKCTQVGVSAWMLRWAMYWADMRALTALYVFPKLKQMYDFSDARIRASILKSDYLSNRIPPSSVQNKGLKAVGGGFVYFRGSESEDDLDSVDADVLALDEYNRLTPENIPVAERRISGSRLGLVRRIGVPTIPNAGIDRLYRESDMRRWYVKCRCGEEQAMTWGENVDEERRLRVCRKCRAELRPAEVAAGRWVAENSETEVLGYHMNKLVVPQVDVAGLVRNAESTLPEERQAFWNRDMAVAYAPAEGRLSPQAIAACQSAGERLGVCLQEGYDGEGVVTMGVDVASKRDLNVRISELLRSGRKRALWIGTVSGFEELERLMDRYRVNMACLDHMPDWRSSMAIAEKFAGRAYLVRYAAATMGKIVNIDEDSRTVTVRRTEAIDAALEGFRGQRNLLPGELPKGYVDHMTNIMRIAERDSSGRKKVKYESTGRDDYAHAEVYDLVAGIVWQYRQTVGDLAEESFSTLDEHLEFERSALAAESDLTYRAGPGEGEPEQDVEYVGGFGE